jgi:hypothetical protein
MDQQLENETKNLNCDSCGDYYGCKKNQKNESCETTGQCGISLPNQNVNHYNCVMFNRVRKNIPDGNPGVTPVKCKVPMMEFFFLPQVHPFNDLTEDSMSYLPQQFQQKPCFNEHNYERGPIGYIAMALLSKDKDYCLPMTHTDDIYKWEGNPIEFFSLNGILAIDKKKEVELISEFRVQSMLDLTCSIGFESYVTIDDEDLVYDRNGWVDWRKSKVYMTGYRAAECSVCGPGNEALHGSRFRHKFSNNQNNTSMFGNGSTSSEPRIGLFSKKLYTILQRQFSNKDLDKSGISSTILRRFLDMPQATSSFTAKILHKVEEKDVDKLKIIYQEFQLKLKKKRDILKKNFENFVKGDMSNQEGSTQQQQTGVGVNQSMTQSTIGSVVTTQQTNQSTSQNGLKTGDVIPNQQFTNNETLQTNGVSGTTGKFGMQTNGQPNGSQVAPNPSTNVVLNQNNSRNDFLKEYREDLNKFTTEEKLQMAEFQIAKSIRKSKEYTEVIKKKMPSIKNSFRSLLTKSGRELTEQSEFELSRILEDDSNKHFVNDLQIAFNSAFGDTNKKEQLPFPGSQSQQNQSQQNQSQQNQQKQEQIGLTGYQPQQNQNQQPISKMQFNPNPQMYQSGINEPKNIPNNTRSQYSAQDGTLLVPPESKSNEFEFSQPTLDTNDAIWKCLQNVGVNTFSKERINNPKKFGSGGSSVLNENFGNYLKNKNNGNNAK